MKTVRIHHDIRRARSLPSEVYHDPAWYDVQRERVFGRSWLWAGEAAGMDRPGHARPFVLLEQCLDEPLLLTCDESGRARCMSNVCTHRGAVVVESEADAQALRCRYHGRRFGLDGRFVSMPAFEGAAGFPSKADDLPAVALGRWSGFLFASLAPDISFEEWIHPVRERTDWMPLDGLVLDPATSRDYEVEANWALYCDNYLEGFHIPYVHRALAERLDWSAYRTEVFPSGSVQVGTAAAGETCFDLPRGHKDHGRAIAAYYFWLFPSTMLNFYPWGLSVNLVEPRGPGRSRVRFLSYVCRPELREQGAGAGEGLHVVEMEDEAVVASVQRGVRSRLYARGRYSPRQEIGVHHFHRMLTERMTSKPRRGAKPRP